MGDPVSQEGSIVVFGIGGCGNNALNHMIECGLVGPTYVAANSDLQALNRCLTPHKIQLGAKLTDGLGCGGDPAVGYKAAEESLEEILEMLSRASLVFIAAGLGGGTGSGGAPLVAEALTKIKDKHRPFVVSVVVSPFPHEINRLKIAEKALEEIAQVSNCVIPIRNSKLMQVMPSATVKEARNAADNILVRAVGGIIDLIISPGDFNIDINDIKTVLGFQGQAIMGYGQASGPDRVNQAIKQAISSPLMAEASICGAKAILINVTADSQLLLSEFTSVNEILVKATGAKDVQVFSGMSLDDSLAESGTMKVTVIATGLTLADIEAKKEEAGPKADLKAAINNEINDDDETADDDESEQEEQFYTPGKRVVRLMARR
jgi:cell division protein FtsZ